MKLKIAFAAGAAMAAMANAAWGRAAELPERLFGIDIASLNSTGQWVNVEHKDWKRMKVVRDASGKLECIILRSRDLSQQWAEAVREAVLLENLHELPTVGRNSTCFSMDVQASMVYLLAATLAGRFGIHRIASQDGRIVYFHGIGGFGRRVELPPELMGDTGVMYRGSLVDKNAAIPNALGIAVKGKKNV